MNEHLDRFTATLTLTPLEAAESPRMAERLTALHTVQLLLGPEVTIGHRPDGAPVLDGPDTEGLHISVSHGAGLLAVALSRHSAVGVDVEARSPRVARVVARVSSPEEMAAVDPLTLWTVKEAVFKAAGIEGLTLGEITVSPDGTATARHRRFLWHVAEQTPRHTVALALPAIT